MAKTDFSSCGKMRTHTLVSLRQPLRCGLTILVCSCVMLGAVQCQARGRQEQDVAEAARQERARKDHARKAHVYTDEDLKRAKILTPEDDDRISAARKQTPPAVGEPTQSALDAALQMPELPLGDIARRYRNAKQILQDTAPFHLPFDEPAFAAPIMELPNVAPPLPSFTASHPKLVVVQPRKDAPPAVTNSAPSAPLRRVDPFAPRMAPAAPRPALHGEAVAPHVPSANARVAPSAPRVERTMPGAGAELRLPNTQPAAPKRSVHTAPALPRVPAGNRPITPAEPRVDATLPDAQLLLPSTVPAAPKPLLYVAPVIPHVPSVAHSGVPSAPRMESPVTYSSSQLVFPGMEPMAPKPSLHLAPAAPHVPSAVHGAVPVAPRLDGKFSGFAAAIPRIDPRVTSPSPAVIPPLSVERNSDLARSVTVQRGDSLWKVARNSLGRGSRWRELLAANPAIVNPERLEVGTSVVIPNGALNLKSEEKSVVVWRGDTLTRIAQANYGRASAWRCVADANPEVTDADRIFEGQTLKLPKSCNP